VRTKDTVKSCLSFTLSSLGRQPLPLWIGKCDETGASALRRRRPPWSFVLSFVQAEPADGKKERLSMDRSANPEIRYISYVDMSKFMTFSFRRVILAPPAGNRCGTCAMSLAPLPPKSPQHLHAPYSRHPPSGWWWHWVGRERERERETL